MADWPPDKYEGKLVLPSPSQRAARASVESSAFDVTAGIIEQLYEAEPKLTRSLLEAMRAASTADLERLFK
jgi:hypothetical protein